VLAELSGECGEILYEDDCLRAVRQAASAARGMEGSEQEAVRDRLAQIAADNPGQAARIREVAAEAGLPIG
jgi:hypothetical protein